MTDAMVTVLPEPVTPSSVWDPWPAAQAGGQLGNGLRLVARQGEGELQVELAHGTAPCTAALRRSRGSLSPGSPTGEVLAPLRRHDAVHAPDVLHDLLQVARSWTSTTKAPVMPPSLDLISAEEMFVPVW
jgi:hypothetical protein